MKSILVTGPNSSLGKELIPLLMNTKYRVFGLINNELSNNISNNYHEINKKDFFNEIDYIIKKIDIVLHLATTYSENYLSLYESNIEIPRCICEAIIKNKLTQKIVFLNADTFYLYEKYIPRRHKEYVKSKKIAVTILRNNQIRFGLQYINIILAHVFGKFDKPGKFIHYIITKARVGDDIIIYNPNAMIEFTYASDVAFAIFNILSNMPLNLNRNISIVNPNNKLMIINFVSEILAIIQSNSEVKVLSHNDNIYNKEYIKIDDIIIYKLQKVTSLQTAINQITYAK